MERVAKALTENDLGTALVRLWVLATDDVRFNRWERAHCATTCDADVANLQDMLERGVALPLATLEEKAIALILATDALLASHHGRAHLFNEFNIDGDTFWLFRQHLAWRATAAVKGQSESMLTWFQYHTIIPAITPEKVGVKLYPSSGAANELLWRMLENQAESLKIWIGHFADQADVTWEPPISAGKSCRTVSVSPATERENSLIAQLEAAKQAGAHFMVLPEFSLDLEQRKKVSQWLRKNNCEHLIYIVPGSFHELDTTQTPNDFFNTAPLFNAEGKVIFTHQKLRRYGKYDIAEDIALGNTLHVLATPLGCLTVLICKDFMDADARVNNLLQHVLVDWVLVPSFGDQKTIDAHQERAKNLAKVVSGTNSAVANTRNSAMDKSGAPLPGFGHSSQTKETCFIPDTGGIVEFPLAQQQPPQPQKTLRIGRKSRAKLIRIK